jgi:hypothetical protein
MDMTLCGANNKNVSSSYQRNEQRSLGTPFDTEYEQFVLEVKNAIIPILEAVQSMVEET